jgi:hypothetical protein
LPLQKGEVKVPCAIRTQIKRNTETCEKLKAAVAVAPNLNRNTGQNTRRILQKNAEKFCVMSELRRKKLTSEYEKCGLAGGKKRKRKTLRRR